MTGRARMMLALLLAALAGNAFARDPAYVGRVHTAGTGADGAVARGTVFLDANRNSRLDAGERGIAGVLVSNGREVVASGAGGRYELPAYDDMNLFITKPAGYATPVSRELVPRFAYIHKVAGSPPLRFGGIEPTGPLPRAINFPLIEDPVGDRFQCLVFGDTQTYTNQEVSYVRDTLGRMLVSRDTSAVECLLFEGDVMGDDLSLYGRFKRIVAAGGVPQYYVGGNHDLDFDATDDAHSFDTFRREWGPEYYSFDIGRVHFVVLDNVRYPCNGVDDHAFCDPARNPTYNGVIHERQLAWLRNDLAHVPADTLGTGPAAFHQIVTGAVSGSCTEPGNGERARSGPEYADPWAVARQSTNGRMAVRSDRGGGDTAGFTTWRGVRWSGVAGPFPAGMLTKRSSHLWRADLPADLAAGVHTLEVSTTDRYGRTFRASTTFEVVETIPEMGWNGGF